MLQNTPGIIEVVSEVLAASQAYMRDQKVGWILTKIYLFLKILYKTGLGDFF